MLVSSSAVRRAYIAATHLLEDAIDRARRKAYGRLLPLLFICFWGIPAVVLGSVVFFLLKDRLRDARWLMWKRACGPVTSVSLFPKR